MKYFSTIDNKKGITFLIFFVIASLTLSGYTLLNESIRLDEAQSLWVATKSVPGIIAYIVQDVHVPLYEILLHFWISLFGNSIFTARLLSFLFFLLSLPVLYLTAKKSSNTLIAFFTVSLYALSPFILWYSFETRMYTLLTLVATLSHYYFITMINSRGRKGYVEYFFTVLFGLYTHYFFILLLFSQILYLFLWYFTKNQTLNSQTVYVEKSRKKILFYLSPVLLAGMFFTPWLIYFFFQGLASNSQPLIPPVTSFNLFQAVINFLFGFQSNIAVSILVSFWPVTVIPIFLIFSKKNIYIPIRHLWYFILTTGLPLLLVFAISFFRPIFLTRYLIFITPSFFFLFAWLLFHISKQTSTALLSFFALCMFLSMFYQNISHNTPVKENYEAVSSYLEKKASSNDVIAITSPFTIYPFEYYYEGTSSIVTIPEWNVYQSGSIPPYSQNKLADNIENYSKVYDNIFVVLSYDQGYEENIKRYMDTHFQRLTLKKFSPGLELREYKLRY